MTVFVEQQLALPGSAKYQIDYIKGGNNYNVNATMSSRLSVHVASDIVSLY